MKNKFFNLNCLLLLFLFLIGFSPQSNNLFLNSVYAEEVTSGLNNITHDNFESALNTELSGDKFNSKDVTVTNIIAGVKLLQTNLESIATAMSGFALALSVVIIAKIGFKIINSGRGDVITFMKQRKDISNAIICILFILIIPILVKSILEFKVPKFLLTSVESNYTGDKYLSDIINHPSSGLVDYMQKTFGSQTTPESEGESGSTKPPESEGESGSDESSGSKNGQTDLLGNVTFEETSDMKGLTRKMYDGVLAIIAAITYAPLLLITSIVGSIGFYPMSLDVRMYDNNIIVPIINNFFSLKNQSSIIDLGTNMIGVIAGGLEILTFIINILYSISKKFCILCLEVVCYYFGIMHLLNKQTENVQTFLTRVAEGVIGMLLFPYFLEFLLDIDGVISMSILRIAGESIPGFGMLTILPSVETAKKGFCLIILSCAMAFVILMLSKSFFIRRIEILLLYIISPVFFLRHMMMSTKATVKDLVSRLLSSVFLTTVYAPVFVIIRLMMSMANSSTVSETSGGQVIYYILILSILWMGKEVIQSVISMFAGGSSAAGSANAQFSKGIDLSKKATKTAMSMTAFGAASGAIKAHDFIKANDGIKGSAKKVEEKLKHLNQKTNQSIEKNGLTKTMGKALGKPLKGVGTYAHNMAKANFWQKYEGAAKQFDKYTPSGAKEAAMNGRANYNEKEIRKKSLDSNHKKRMNDLKDKERRAEFQDYIYKKYGNNPDKARDMMNKFDKMMENNQNAKDFFENNQDFFTTATKLENSKFVSQTTKDLIQDTKHLFNSTNKLEQAKQEAIKNGDYEKAIELESAINTNKTFFNKNVDKIERAGFEEIRQGERITSFKTVNNVAGTTDFIPNDINSVFTVKDSQTVNKELNNLLHNTTDASAKQQIKEFINSGVIDKKTGAVNQEGLTNLIASLNNTDIDKTALTDFAEKTFTYNNQQAVSHINLIESLSTSQSQDLANRIHSGYNANNQTLQNSLAILESNCLDKSMVNNAVSNIKTNILANGKVPSATEISQFTADLVSKNAITKEQASQFLGSTFGCNKDDANAMIDYNIAKTVYDNNQAVISNVLQDKSINSADDLVSNISNKLGITEQQAQYVLEHNRNSEFAPTKSQELVARVHSGYNTNNQALQNSLAILESNSLDKAMANKAISNIKTTYLANGKVPSATEISQFTADLVSKNAITKEQASQFLGSTFGCNKDDANAMIDYNIAKIAYDDNQSVVSNILKGTSITNNDDLVSNISNKLGITEQQAQYVLEHNRHSEFAPNKSQELVTRVHSGYNANNQALQNSLAILESKSLDKSMANKAISNIKTTYLANGKVPSATEISQFTVDLVSKNAITKEQASQFLGSTFGCNKDDANAMIDYTIAKNVFNNNQSVVTDVLQGKSINSTADIVSNISNKLGVTEQQAQYVLEHNRSSEFAPTKSQEVVSKIHSGYNGNNQQLRYSLSILEGHCLDKNIVNDAVSNIKTTYLYKGDVPSASEISHFTADLVSKNAITKEQASQFLGSTFGCNKDEASTVIDYTIAKNVYDTNRDVVAKEDAVFTISNKLGVTEQQAQYVLEHNSSSKYTPTQSQTVVNKVHSGYNGDNQKLQHSLSVLESNSLDKAMANKAISNIKTTYLSNGQVPSATEISQFTVDLVSKNAITKEQASQFLGSTFGCNKDEASTVIDYTIAKNVYDTNKDVVVKEDIVSNISNKLGVTEQQAQYVLEHNRSSSSNATQSQKVVTKVHSGYNGDTQKLQTYLYSLEKNGLDKAVVNHAVSNFKTTHLSNGKAPSATDISQLTAELVSKKAISQEQASQFLGSTFGCNKDEANTVIDYTIAKNVYDTNKDIVVKEDVVSNLSNELGVTTKQVECIIEYNNDNTYQNNLSQFNKSNGAILDYINLETNNSTQINAAKQKVERITPPQKVNILHEATSFRGVNIANTQLEQLKKETENTEIIHRIEVVQKELSTCNNNAEAEATMKKFFIRESSNSEGLNKSVLNKAAQTSLGFNSNQADVHLKSFVSNNIDTSTDIGQSYKIEIASYKSDSDTNVLDYLNLTSGAHTDIYNSSAINFVNEVVQQGGILSLELSDMKNKCDINKTPIKVSDVEAIITNNPKAVDDFLKNQAKTIKNGTQKVKELVSNIDSVKDNTHLTLETFNQDDLNKRNNYTNNVEDYIGSGAINPQEFEQFYIPKPKNP